MSVDLPSSTDPHVTSRTSSADAASAPSNPEPLEVADTLPVLHGCLGDSVVRARLAALGDAGRGDLGDDRLERPCLREHPPGTGHVADRPEAHRRREWLLVRVPLDE